jgi:hypothetical protein
MTKSFSRKQIEHCLGREIEKLCQRDLILIQNDVNERSISHRLALYLQNEFPEWDVDCEYNPQGEEPKVIRAIETDIGK